MTKKYIFFGILLYICSLISPIKATSELQLSVSYDAICGEPTTFTLNASGGSGNYMYYLGNVTRDGEDGAYFVVDPSQLPGYQQSNTFQFTFCASGLYTLHFYVMDKGSQPIQTKRTIVKVKINDPAYPSIETIADQIAAQCRANCQDDYERALWLHDWLVDHCHYDYDYLYCGAEGALVRGKGTCESYHRAYTMLLNRVGIANGRMEGNGHVWTAVRMNGQWYQVDVTWDDNDYSYRTYENYIYFGLTDDLMKFAHSQHMPHSGYVSHSFKDNALIRSGRIHQWSDPIEATIQQQLNAHQSQFSIPISSSLPPSYQSIIYNLVAYQLTTQSWSTKDNTVTLQVNYTDQQLHFLATFTPVSLSKPEISQPSTPTPEDKPSKPEVLPQPEPDNELKPSVTPSTPSKTEVGNTQIETIISRLEENTTNESPESVTTPTHISYTATTLYPNQASYETTSSSTIPYILILLIISLLIKYGIQMYTKRKKT